MTLGLLFWVLMLFWAIYGFAWGWPWRDAASRPVFGSWLILFEPDALATLARAWERSPLACAALGLAGVLGLVAGYLWLGHLEDAAGQHD
jgi:hypothetical protein